jgi:uncharacterized membrane protein
MGTDIGLIIAIVGTGIAMVGTLIAVMFWSRSEANLLRSEAKEDRKDLVQLVYAIREETTKQISAIHLEIKDFHNRLCIIEKERK